MIGKVVEQTHLRNRSLVSYKYTGNKWSVNSEIAAETES
jgi:hypothetical protein